MRAQLLAFTADHQRTWHNLPLNLPRSRTEPRSVAMTKCRISFCIRIFFLIAENVFHICIYKKKLSSYCTSIAKMNKTASVCSVTCMEKNADLLSLYDYRGCCKVCKAGMKRYVTSGRNCSEGAYRTKSIITWMRTILVVSWPRLIFT